MESRQKAKLSKGLDSMREILSCFICKQLCVDPFEVSCGHMNFCKKCVPKFKENSSHCIKCKKYVGTRGGIRKKSPGADINFTQHVKEKKKVHPLSSTVISELCVKSKKHGSEVTDDDKKSGIEQNSYTDNEDFDSGEIEAEIDCSVSNPASASISIHAEGGSETEQSLNNAQENEICQNVSTKRISNSSSRFSVRNASLDRNVEIMRKSNYSDICADIRKLYSAEQNLIDEEADELPGNNLLPNPNQRISISEFSEMDEMSTGLKLKINEIEKMLFEEESTKTGDINSETVNLDTETANLDSETVNLVTETINVNVKNEDLDSEDDVSVKIIYCSENVCQ